MTTILKEKRMPDEPGVYLMKDGGGKIIYIGKAKNLKKRVTSYFTRHNLDIGWKTARLVSNISDIEFVVTDNEIEAFLLESNLIKRFRPVFNIELKDQQRYTYVKITDEPFPRLLVARRNRNGEFLGPKGRVYGPFVRGSAKFLTVGLLRKLFKIRICNRLPKTPCLQYFIKNCDAPCIANVTRKRYMANVVSLQDILDGKSSIEKFASKMQDEMKRASDLGDYERAKEIRDTLYRLNNLRVKQKMEKAVNRNPDEEYVGIMKDDKKGIAHVMALRRTRGVICDRKKFEFDLVGDNSLSSFLLQYYSSIPLVPRFVYVNEDPEDSQVLEMSLEKIAGHRVSIFNVERVLTKEKHQLMDLISRNLSMYIERGYDPAVVVDIATLTGAIVVALGHTASGVMGSDDELVEEIRGAGDRADERVWPLPLWDDYRDLMKSDIADVKNSGGRPAGSISAGWFLREFVDGFPWAHLDIAGTAYSDHEDATRVKGPTGVGVRLFSEFVLGRNQKT